MNVRFGEPLRESLEKYAHRSGQTKSGVINVALSEWLAIEAHPHIRFMTEVTGERRATLIGGPQVWTIAESWLAHDAAGRDVITIAETLGLSPNAVESALAYWADYRDEIDGVIERHHAAQEDALAAWERRQSLMQG